MKNIYLKCLTLAAGFVLPVHAEIKLPPLAEQLRPLNQNPTPSMADAKLAIQALGNTALERTSPDEKKALADLINQIKQPFLAEYAYQTLIARQPQYRADLDSAHKTLERLQKNPPMRVGGGIDVGHRDMYVKRAHEMATAAEQGLAEIKHAAGRLAEQLTTTNSMASAYLRLGRADIALSLASGMFAVAERQRLNLEFEPALSYAWVRMKKLSQVEQEVEKDRARRLLVGYVALHEGAKAIGGMGADALYKSAKSGDLVGSIASFTLLNEGLKQQARFDKTIDVCLEVVFHQPEPSDYSAKMRLVLDRVLKPVSGKSVGERFSENLVRDALAAVDARLATPQIASSLVGILSAGLAEATRQP
ncbi:hypothetical protein [Prosthecobacter sp.]|uniref:hypothetical protein n=1 Tax=Prosthecobacter sp. TaxID=1965333 RepID=UPI0037843CCC